MLSAQIDRLGFPILACAVVCGWGACDASLPSGSTDGSVGDGGGSDASTTLADGAAPRDAGTGAEADATPTVDAEPAPTPCLPGGKRNFVFTLGALDAAQNTNWVRLGTYTFTCDGTAPSGNLVSKQWRYNQTSRRRDRVLTGVWGVDCTPAERDCELRTAGTFAADVTAEESWTATYSIEGELLTIVWSPGVEEIWRIRPHPDGALVRLSYYGQVGISPPPTRGWAYGSNAPYSSAATTTELVTTYGGKTLTFQYYIWNRSSINQGSPDFLMAGWSQCNGGQSMGKTGCRTLAAGGGGCALPVDPHWCAAGQSPMMYYIADLPYADRRNISEFWTLCLAEGRNEYCYTGNSHVRPMLQIIDDDGEWHGWVGVEASKGYDVQGDYIAVFRKADF